MLWISVFPGTLLADEPVARRTSTVVTAAELTLGAPCRISTKREGRISICYEGTVKAVDQQQITILAERSQVTWCSKLVRYPVFGSAIGFGWQWSEDWEPLNNQEIEIATENIHRIRLLQGPFCKKSDGPQEHPGDEQAKPSAAQDVTEQPEHHDDAE
ncbi:MAG TPA: hypothetical protein VIK18_25760 [Pirellulales bacterium]